MTATQASYEADLELLIREYLRVSFDASGRQRSNEEQHDDNVRLVDRTPGYVHADAPAYSDVGSASRFAKKRRSGYDELVADIAAGRFGADVLQIWESSRGSRDVGEWVVLLKVCAERNVRLLVTTHDRLYDPANHRDWKSLMEDAVDGEYESRKTSQRVRRDMSASAQTGKVPGGRRAFGYSADGKRKDPAEAKIVKECVRRVLAGETIRALAADLNRRGVTTSAGNAWHPGALKAMLVGHRIVGQRTHHGRVVAKGQWPAIIDEATHRRLLAVLANRTPIGRRGRTPWLLTGFLRCGECGAPLVGQTDGKRIRRYICRKAPGYKGCGHLGIQAEPLEKLLGRLLVQRLADAEARRQSDAGPDDSGEQGELDRIAALRLEAIEDREVLGRAAFNEYMAKLERDQRTVEATIAAKVHESAPLDFIDDGRAWGDLDTEEQRRRLGAVINYVTVRPATTRGAKVFEASRVNAPGLIDWRA